MVIGGLKVIGGRGGRDKVVTLAGGRESVGTVVGGAMVGDVPGSPGGVVAGGSITVIDVVGGAVVGAVVVGADVLTGVIDEEFTDVEVVEAEEATATARAVLGPRGAVTTGRSTTAFLLSRTAATV